jgi:hypothetical protein
LLRPEADLYWLASVVSSHESKRVIRIARKMISLVPGMHRTGTRSKQ